MFVTVFGNSKRKGRIQKYVACRVSVFLFQRSAFRPFGSNLNGKENFSFPKSFYSDISYFENWLQRYKDMGESEHRDKLCRDFDRVRIESTPRLSFPRNHVCRKEKRIFGFETRRLFTLRMARISRWRTFSRPWQRIHQIEPDCLEERAL